MSAASLGFTNKYCHFIHHYAQIACPLNLPTTGENANRKKSVAWTPECNMAFEKLKSLCSSTPILAYADYTKRFKLFMDASVKGLGLSFTKSKMMELTES